MTDIVAELRERYEAAPQGEWESVAGRYIETLDDSGDFVIAIARVHQPEYADLIVAMHEALPALLDAVEATRASEAHLITPFEKFGGFDSWADECERLREVKLAALKRSGAA